MTTLWILRHAKATPEDRGEARDHDRPLLPLGLEQAAALGSLVASGGAPLAGLERPQLVVCSSALRTRQTFDAFEATAQLGAALEVSSALYEADVDQMLHLLGGYPEVPSVLVVGHQPTVGWLREDLLAASERAERTTTVCSLAVLSSPAASVAELAAGTCHLEAFVEKLVR